MKRRALLLPLAVVAAALAAPGAAAPDRRVPVRIYAPKGAVGARCDAVRPLRREVRPPAVLAGALRALLAGPTRAERRAGYGGWFSPKTAGSLRSVRLAGSTAFVDFHDFSRTIPNASTSCGSALLLAQLDRTARQFPAVARAIYSFDGSRRAFYEWLQRATPR